MKAVVLLSGGIDSLVVLADAIARGRECTALAFDYGQRHRRELDAAAAVAGYYGVPLAVMTLPRFGPSALTGGGDVPTGVPADDPAQAATVVPGRNMVFAAVGVAHAVAVGAREVLLGCHAGDAPVYPDCRPHFLIGMAEAAYRGYGVTVSAPLLSLDKAGIVRRGLELGVPLGLAYSCYRGAEWHCGTCGSCLSRKAAFAAAGAADPTRYAPG